MKKNVITLMAMVMCLLSPWGHESFAEETNLVRNGSFEKDMNKDGTPDNWNVPNKEVVSLDTKEIIDGEKSLKIEVNAPKGKNPCNMVSQEIKGFKTGTIYTVSTFISTEIPEEDHFAYLSINCRDADGKVLSTTTEQKVKMEVWHNGGFIKGNTYQQKVVFKTFVQEKTAALSVELILMGAGKAWFDAVQLEEGEVATKYRESGQP